MQFDWRMFLMALGLAFVLEGIPYFMFAEKMPGVLRLLSERDPKDLRRLGGMAILAGLLVVFLVRGT